MKPKWRCGIGLAAAVLLILSSAAHSLVGWPELRTELELSALGPDLIRGLKLSWYFGGLAMLVFGVVALQTFVALWGGRQTSLEPARIIGIAYLGFGIAALVFVDSNPFYLIFVIPGLLLLIATGFRPGQSELAGSSKPG